MKSRDCDGGSQSCASNNLHASVHLAALPPPVPFLLLLFSRVRVLTEHGRFRLGDAAARAEFARDVLSSPIDQALTVRGKASAAHGAEFIERDLRLVLGV